jgi:hypothetical protein
MLAMHASARCVDSTAYRTGAGKGPVCAVDSAVSVDKVECTFVDGFLSMVSVPR